MFRLVSIPFILALLLAPAALAHDDEIPTVAILRFGPLFSLVPIQQVVISSIQASGLISEEEAVAFRETGRDIDGERLRLLARDANLDFANINTIVESALDEGADVIITLSTPVTLAALNATLDMEDPPALIFAAVYNPYAAGIADASCIKPAHVTGVESVTNYEDIVPLLLLQDPDIQTIGTIYSASETSGRAGAEEIARVGAELGLEVLEASIASVADLLPAAEGLVEKGAEAFLIPADLLTVAGLPALMQVGVENSIPVFHSAANADRDGATVSAGVSEMQLQGSLVGALLVGHLNGEIDISGSGIASLSDLTVRINLDVAEMQDLEISAALMERADAVLQDGVDSGTQLPKTLKELGLAPEMIEKVTALFNEATSGRRPGELPDFPPELHAIVAKALAANDMQGQLAAAMVDMQCTPEMIAEQQAALDAAGA